MICPNCGNALTYYFSKNDFRILRCGHCALMQVENIPADLSKYYIAGYFRGQADLDGYVDYESDKEVNEANFRAHLRQIKKLSGRNNGELLEIGCATGYFMEMAKSEGWSVRGVEISDYAAAKCREKGLTVISGEIEGIVNDANINKFDVVILFDVIEHVRDPRADLVRLSKVIKSGGLLVISTPDAGSLWARLWGKRWHAVVPPQHLFYFNEKNLSNLLEKTGFHKIYSEHSGKYFRLPYIVRMLYSWTGWKIWSKLLSLLSSNVYLSKISIPINLGDTLFVIARKSERQNNL